MPNSDITPKQIVDFWFPDSPAPEPEKHLELWMWRMRGGANDEIIAKYSNITQRAANGEFDHWTNTALGRFALIIILDQFPRTIWAGTAKAFSQDMRAKDFCLEGLQNGHYDALPNVWFKTAYRIPLVHCECPEHLQNMDRVLALSAQLLKEAPDNLKAEYEKMAAIPVRHREVIRRFGRHSHRNDVLGRDSTPEERIYIDSGEFPHNAKMGD